MKAIVIIGSTRGIGYGLADAFLAHNCAVTVSGRTPIGVEKAVQELSARHVASIYPTVHGRIEWSPAVDVQLV